MDFGQMDLTALKVLFVRAHQTYHSGGGAESVLSNEEYDTLKRKLLNIIPHWPPLHQTGWPINPLSPLTKSPHVGFMGSINNARDYAGAVAKNEPEEVQWSLGMKRWLEAHGMPVTGTLKVDGLSVAIEYKHGVMIQALTRGDCAEGEDVTHHLIMMPHVPIGIQSDLHIVIRGEVVMFTEQWNEFKAANPAYVAARNAASGILGSKETTNTKYLRFVVHDVQILEENSPAVPRQFNGMLHAIGAEGFLIPNHCICGDIKEATAFFDLTRSARERGVLPYEIDGVVFRINHTPTYEEKGIDRDRCPRGAVAWKFEAGKAVTRLNQMFCTVGHTGAITPVGHVAPVVIGGVTVSKASLANFEEIKRLNVGIGDQVEVSRQGDVIPKILRATDRSGRVEPLFEPLSCPVCYGKVGRKQNVKGADGAILYCLNPGCEAKTTGKIKKWIDSVGIMDVGPGVIQALVDSNLVSDPADLYLLVQAEVATMEFGKGQFGDRRADKIMKNINSKKELPLNVFLGALGVAGLGEGIARNVREKAPGQFDLLKDWTDPENLVKFKDQVSLPNVAEGIAAGIREKLALIGKLVAVGVAIVEPAPAQAASGTGSLSGMVFCLTGSFPAPKSFYNNKILAAGGAIEDDVRSNVTHVVVNEIPEAGKETGKAKKAKAKGLPLLSLNDLLEVLHAGKNFQTIAESGLK